MLVPPLANARELVTSINTKIGATAFNNPTKIFPRIAIADAFGATTPKITPITKPMKIRRMRLS